MAYQNYNKTKSLVQQDAQQQDYPPLQQQGPFQAFPGDEGPNSFAQQRVLYNNMNQNWGHGQQQPPQAYPGAPFQLGPPSYQQQGYPVGPQGFNAQEHYQVAKYRPTTEQGGVILDRSNDHHKKSSKGATIGGGLLGFALTGRLTGAAGGAIVGKMISSRRHD